MDDYIECSECRSYLRDKLNGDKYCPECDERWEKTTPTLYVRHRKSVCADCSETLEEMKDGIAHCPECERDWKEDEIIYWDYDRAHDMVKEAVRGWPYGGTVIETQDGLFTIKDDLESLEKLERAIAEYKMHMKLERDKLRRNEE